MWPALCTRREARCSACEPRFGLSTVHLIRMDTYIGTYRAGDAEKHTYSLSRARSGGWGSYLVDELSLARVKGIFFMKGRCGGF